MRAKVGGAAAGIPVFIDEKLDAAAGVRQPLDAYAKDHPGRARDDRRASSRSGRRWARRRAGPRRAAYLRDFVEEMKATGFVADALKRSGQVAKVAERER